MDREPWDTGRPFGGAPGWAAGANGGSAEARFNFLRPRFSLKLRDRPGRLADLTDELAATSSLLLGMVSLVLAERRKSRGSLAGDCRGAGCSSGGIDAPGPKGSSVADSMWEDGGRENSSPGSTPP